MPNSSILLFNPPKDFENPQWNKAEKVHDWKNYISEELQSIWDSFTVVQKSVIAKNAQEQASCEDWD